MLVLIHAFPVGVRLWDPQRDAFPGWRMVTPALPGFDGSALIDDVSVDGYAHQVLAQLDEQRIDRAVFGGVSMGGYVTFAVLRQAPQRVAGVILADTRSTADRPEAVEGRRRMLQKVHESGPAAVAAEMLPKLLGKTTHERRPDIVERVRQMILGQTPEGIAAAITVLMSRPDSTPLLSGIRVPALVAVGEEDVLTPPSEMEAMAAAIPGATFVRIPQAGHLANLENPAAFNTTMGDFLQSL